MSHSRARSHDFIGLKHNKADHSYPCFNISARWKHQSWMALPDIGDHYPGLSVHWHTGYFHGSPAEESCSKTDGQQGPASVPLGLHSLVVGFFCCLFWSADEKPQETDQRSRCLSLYVVEPCSIQSLVPSMVPEASLLPEPTMAPISFSLRVVALYFLFFSLFSYYNTLICQVARNIVVPTPISPPVWSFHHCLQFLTHQPNWPP